LVKIDKAWLASTKFVAVKFRSVEMQSLTSTSIVDFVFDPDVVVSAVDFFAKGLL